MFFKKQGKKLIMVFLKKSTTYHVPTMHCIGGPWFYSGRRNTDPAEQKARVVQVSKDPH